MHGTTFKNNPELFCFNGFILRVMVKMITNWISVQNYLWIIQLKITMIIYNQ